MRLAPWIVGSALALGLLSVSVAQAATPVTAYFFWGDGCPHCAAEKEALVDIERTYPELRVRAFEVYNSQENIDLMRRVGEVLGTDVGGVPLTVIGDRVFVGFSHDSTAPQLIQRIEECRVGGCPDSVEQLLAQPGTVSALPPTTALTSGAPDGPSAPSLAPVLASSAPPTRYSVPLLGDFDARTVSLPLLAVVMGTLDGFNPCAMWTLLFLLSLLIGMKNRARRWILGAAFIVASTAVYALFMTAWLQLILFLGFIIWVRLGIGAIALIGGGYSIRQGLRTESGCVVEGDDRRKRIFHRLRDLVGQRSFLLALVGIITLAFAVNLVELICSAGLPAVFTQVLAINALPAWESFSLIALYLLFFMLDDLIVFFVTMTTLELTGVTTKYARISHLIGGALMVAIGLLLLFKPEWLLFG